MPTSFFTTKTIAIILFGALAGYWLVAHLVDERLDQYHLSIVDNITAQEQVMTAIAVTTARNGADALVESIVRDCPTIERVRFDTLLGQLNNSLSQSELTELERLFGRCGNFFAQRKAMMVARLEREVALYEVFVSQLATVRGDVAVQPYPVSRWQALVTQERRISDALSRLVVLQDEIIKVLIGGATITSPDITTLLTEVSELQDTLAVASIQVGELRTELINL